MDGGKLVVISAPSGAGKTTIARAMLAAHPSLEFSVSATTRPMRQNEQNGRDYFFLSKEEFKARVGAGDFVEWEEIYGNYYGTLKAEIDRAMRAGRHILFDVDVKGGLSIRGCYAHALLIFVRPPSPEILRERLSNRKTEDPATIARRMERVAMEMEKGKEFQHQILNDDLPRVIAEANVLVENYLRN
jgi:guanylate kinase